MKKTIPLLVLVILLPAIAIASSCVTFRDCPAQACAGSARSCKDNICRYSQCVVPAEEELNQNNVETFRQAVKPYEAGINLSARTKNPSLIRNNMLASLGLQGILLLMLKGILVMFLALAAALFFVFAKEKGFLWILLIFVGILAVAGAGFFIISGQGGIAGALGGGTSWNSAKPGDFIGTYAKRSDLGEFQSDYLSPRLIDAADYELDRDGQEADVIVIEMDSQSFLGTLRLGSLKGDKINIAGEQVLSQDLGLSERYIFDEDRFVFIVSAAKEDIDGIARDIISRYPGQPTESRLFAEDDVPPQINVISPKTGALTNIDRLSFSVSDNGSGVDASSITVKNLAGFTVNACKVSAEGYLCTYTPPEPAQGEVDFQIWASDRAGNPKKVQGNFIFDSSPAELAMISPQDKGYTNSRRIVFRLEDRVSGIADLRVDGSEPDEGSCNMTKYEWTCAVDAGPAEGMNSLEIYSLDNAGNSGTLHGTFYFDDVPPVISAAYYSFDITDSSPLAEIRVNGDRYPISGCSRSGDTYHCASNARIDSVSALDAAGNLAQEP